MFLIEWNLMFSRQRRFLFEITLAQLCGRPEGMGRGQQQRGRLTVPAAGGPQGGAVPIPAGAEPGPDSTLREGAEAFLRRAGCTPKFQPRQRAQVPPPSPSALRPQGQHSDPWQRMGPGWLNSTKIHLGFGAVPEAQNSSSSRCVFTEGSGLAGQAACGQPGLHHPRPATTRAPPCRQGRAAREEREPRCGACVLLPRAKYR